MPEGDAVLRTAQRLDAALRGAVVVAAELRWPDVAAVDLVGRAVLGTGTHGKHLLTRFDDGRTLHTHLRMEGAWRVVTPRGRYPDPDVRVLLEVRGAAALGLRLGMVDVLPTAEERRVIGHLGPDVLGPDFPTTGLRGALDRLARRPVEPVGQVLLDQTVVAGLGTLWVAESLWSRHVWPWTPTADVVDLPSLLMAGRRLMERSMVVPGTARGVVHGREGQACTRCRTPIEVGRVGSPPSDRPMFWCRTCQPPVSRPA